MRDEGPNRVSVRKGAQRKDRIMADLVRKLAGAEGVRQRLDLELSANGGKGSNSRRRDACLGGFGRLVQEAARGQVEMVASCRGNGNQTRVRRLNVTGWGFYYCLTITLVNTPDSNLLLNSQT